MKRTDWFILGAVLFAALAAFCVSRWMQAASPGYVTVYVGESIFARVPVDAYQTITVDQGDGKVNVVMVDRQGVHMESSTCHNQLCVRQGVISSGDNGRSLTHRIICLPNGVTVALTEAED